MGKCYSGRNTPSEGNNIVDPRSCPQCSGLTPVLTSFPEPRLSCAAHSIQHSKAKYTSFVSSLHQKLMDANDERTNLVCSPLSVLIAMASCINGARHKTRDEIVKVLFPGEHDEASNTLQDEAQLAADILAMSSYYNAVYMGSEDGADESPKIVMAHKMWIHKGIPIQKAFIKSTGFDQVETTKLTNTRKAARKINAWCLKATNDLIGNVVTEEDLEHSRWVITNVIYFKAKFHRRFKTGKTKSAMFYTDPTHLVKLPRKVRMMHSDQPRYYFKHPRGFDVVRLNFRTADGGISDLSLILAIQTEVFTPGTPSGDELEGIVLPPNPGDDAMKAQMSEEGIRCFKPEDIVSIGDQWQHEQILLYVPKFKFQWTTDMSRELQGMGIIDAFNQNADFSGISGADSFFINRVLHKAVFEMDEQGVEACAATMDIGQGKGVQPRREPKELPTIRFDHPFDFFIWDQKADMALFGGRYHGRSKR